MGGKFISWALAVLVLASALVGAARRLGDRDRFDSDMRIADLTWQQFEGYLAEYFRRHGATVTYRGGSSSDGGVDLVVDDASGRRIVQAKHWKARSVGVVPLRALWGVLNDERADGAVCVTSGEFTADAVEFARGKRSDLINGAQLARLVAEVKGAPAPTPTGTMPVGSSAPMPAAQPTKCPKCHEGVLERKLARRGTNAGSYFLSCSRFPCMQVRAEPLIARVIRMGLPWLRATRQRRSAFSTIQRGQGTWRSRQPHAVGVQSRSPPTATCAPTPA